jgi:NAD dependent epimerase/dehydratase family enzyme
VLKSCTVSSDKIVKAGFRFEHPAIDDAIKSVFLNGKS